MIRKDDPAFKKAVDSIKAMIERRHRQAVRQVVHAADPAGQHQGRLPCPEATKAAWANPNDKPVGRLREEVALPGCTSPNRPARWPPAQR